MAATTASQPRRTADHDADVQVSVVVPVHNERANLPALHREIGAAFAETRMAPYRPFEVVYVEDGSDDGTARWVDERAAMGENVRAIHLKRSYGQSAALAAGFDAARGEVIVPMDGDLQNDPADIPRLLDRLEEGYDCVSGWRKERHDPWHKTIPSAIQTRLAKLTGPDINDFGCTLTAYRAGALEDIDLYGEGHRYIPAMLYDKGYTVDELEVNHRPREHGESRYGVGRLVRGFVDLLFHVFWVRYSTRPLHIFGSFGLGLFGVGLALGAWLLAENYLLGAQLLPNLPQLVLAVALTLFGFGVFALGVISEMLTKVLYRDEREYRIDRVVE